jgi:hypothetical protein
MEDKSSSSSPSRNVDDQRQRKTGEPDGFFGTAGDMGQKDAKGVGGGK